FVVRSSVSDDEQGADKRTRLMKTIASGSAVSSTPTEPACGGAPVPTSPLPARSVCQAGEAGAGNTAKLRRRRTLLVAVDFTEASARALDYAVSLARRMNAKIMLLHVVDGNYGEAFLESSVRLR